MTVRELQKRNDKAQTLRVIKVGDGNFFVESSNGKVAYKSRYTEDEHFCTCGDYQRNTADADFLCKHLMAVGQCVTDGEAEKRDFLKKCQPKLNPEFVKNIEGKDFVTYQGLLDLAHQKGLSRIEVEIVQHPNSDNQQTAIVKAVAESRMGEVFSDVGDANPTNCNQKVSKHLLRMASTRAKARCLRDMTNIGITCLEELGDLNEVVGDNGNQSNVRPLRKRSANKGNELPVVQGTQNQTGNPGTTATTTTPNGPVNGSSQTATNQQTSQNKGQPTNRTQSGTNGNNSNGSKPRMSEAQNRAIANLSRRRGLSMEQVGSMSLEMFGVELNHITAADASSLIRHLQQAA